MQPDPRYSQHHPSYNKDLGEATEGIAKALMRTIDDMHLLRSCINCNFFNEAQETCNVYHARPPARIIARGCDQHSCEIPF